MEIIISCSSNWKKNLDFSHWQNKSSTAATNSYFDYGFQLNVYKMSENIENSP